MTKFRITQISHDIALIGMINDPDYLRSASYVFYLNKKPLGEFMVSEGHYPSQNRKRLLSVVGRNRKGDIDLTLNKIQSGQTLRIQLPEERNRFICMKVTGVVDVVQVSGSFEGEDFPDQERIGCLYVSKIKKIGVVCYQPIIIGGDTELHIDPLNPAVILIDEGIKDGQEVCIIFDNFEGSWCDEI